MKESTGKIAPLKAWVSRPLPFAQLSEKSRSSIDSEGNWLITLSDLLSLLLVCFVVLFVLTRNAARPVQKLTRQPKQRHQKVLQGIRIQLSGKRSCMR